MRTISNNLAAIIFNALVGVLLAVILGFNPLLGAVGLNAFAVLLAFVKFYITGVPFMECTNVFAGLLKEIWISILMENFYPSGDWLTAGQNMTEFVDNNTINLADCGVDPEVYINNTTYPIQIEERTDTALTIGLDYYDTKNTVVRNATAIQLAYNKAESVVRQHRQALRKKNLQKAAHAYGPAGDSANTPILQLAANGSIIDLIIEAQQKLDDVDAPEDRILVLNPEHQAKLRKEDKVLYKEIFGQKGTNELYGFKVFKTTVTPTYNGTAKTKKAFGAAAAPTTDVKSSLFYVASEVMYADGEYDMYSRLKDPEARGDIIGFQKRFVALPIRNKYIGAIINTPAA
jgi:hypothetical protein